MVRRNFWKILCIILLVLLVTHSYAVKEGLLEKEYSYVYCYNLLTNYSMDKAFNTTVKDLNVTSP